VRVCFLCLKELHRTDRIARGIEGWEERRAGGGANKIMLRRETGRLAHLACVHEGRDPNQLEINIHPDPRW